MVTMATEHSPRRQAWISVNDGKDSASDPLWCRGRGFVDPSAPWGRPSSFRSGLSKCSLSCVAWGLHLTGCASEIPLRVSAMAESSWREKFFLWLFSGHPPGFYLLMASLDQQDNKKHLRNTHTADRDTAESGRGLSNVFESTQIRAPPVRYPLYGAGSCSLHLIGSCSGRVPGCYPEKVIGSCPWHVWTSK